MAADKARLDVGDGAVEELAGPVRPADKTPQILDWVERKFLRLRDEWKAKRGHDSSTVNLVMHSAYQRIIGLGPDAVPLLLRELATNPDRWFWALRAITEEDPVPEADRGNSEAMTRAWLAWGRERGYKW
jgi:hypothetical protein